MAFSFLMLASLVKSTITQKITHFKKLGSLVLMKQTVHFFQLPLLLLVQYLAKTETVPHLGGCNPVGLIFKAKLGEHMQCFQRTKYSKPQRRLFLD